MKVAVTWEIDIEADTMEEAMENLVKKAII